jgi:hypothetical protein
VGNHREDACGALYSCILRQIQKKSSQARFKKVERGQFALKT